MSEKIKKCITCGTTTCPECGHVTHGSIHVGDGSVSVGHDSPTTINDIPSIKKAVVEPMRDSVNYQAKAARVRHAEDIDHTTREAEKTRAELDARAADRHAKGMNPFRAICATRARRRRASIIGLSVLFLTVIAQTFSLLAVSDSIGERHYGTAATFALLCITSAGIQAVLSGFFAPLIYAEMVAGAVFEKDPTSEQ